MQGVGAQWGATKRRQALASAAGLPIVQCGHLLRTGSGKLPSISASQILNFIERFFLVKIIYASSRKPHVTQEQFIRRWRFHGALAMIMPSFFGGVTRYIQNDGMKFDEEMVGMTFFDAVGEIHFESIEYCRAAMLSPELQSTIMLDGDEIFDRSGGITATVKDRVLYESSRGGNAVFSFVVCDDGGDRGAFQTSWVGENEASICHLLESGLATLGGAVVSTPVDIGMALSVIDGVLQLSFEDLADGAALYCAWRADIVKRMAAAGFNMQITSVLARACVLYDRAYIPG